MPDPISWLIIGILLFVSFFFSAAETALSSCNRFKMAVKADDGSRSAKLVLKVIDRHDRALMTILIGNNIAAIGISAISAVLFYNMFSNTGMEQYASILNTVIMTFAVYVIGDTLPKTLAKLIPDTLSLILVYPVVGLMVIFFPITYIFSLLIKLIEKIFRVKEKPLLSEEEFTDTVQQVTDDEVLTEEQTEIINSALEFADTNVKEVFTPLDKMVAINLKTTNKEELNELLLKTNYSRIPVYVDNINNIIGVLHVQTYLKEYFDNNKVSIRSTLTKPYFVSNRIMIDDLFNGFKKRKTHIAFVRDENNVVIGMVTMEDVLEELVKGISEPTKVGGNK